MSDKRPFTPYSFNQYLAEKKLMGSYNAKSNTTYLPPRPVCPKTFDENMEWVELSGKGKLVAFTSITIGQLVMNKRGFDRNNPYVSGIVELDEGPRISAFITGLDAKHPENIKIGTPVTVEYLEYEEGETKKTVLAFRANPG